MQRSALLALVALAVLLPGSVGVADRNQFAKLDVRKWEAEAKQKASHAAKSFLEEAGQNLLVPVDVDVFLIGFDGTGGYAHTEKAAQLSGLLTSGITQHCPHSLETRELLGVCFQIQYHVLGGEDLGEEPLALLHKIETYLKANMRDAWQHLYIPTGRGGGPPDTNRTPEYVVDAAGMEPIFDSFLDWAYGEAWRTTKDSKEHNWHHLNPIFVINPSKVRANPKAAPEDVNHRVPNFLSAWAAHQYHPQDLDKEEAGFVYRYSYNGAGEATTWMSSRNYAVIDVAAGPTTYGPAVSREGAVIPGSMPSLKDVYKAIFEDLKDIGHSLTEEQHAQVIAQHAQKALFEGSLAATLQAAARALFAPDVVTENFEAAKYVLVPVVLLTDYELTEKDQAGISDENFLGINLTQIEKGLARLIDAEQEATVVSAHHPLSRHRGIAAALWRARRTKTEHAFTQHAHLGFHSLSHTSIDPDLLMEELAEAADTLTHGLVGGAHAMSKADAHPLEQLRHDGTRVLPVFVISLMRAPEDIILANRDMVAAYHDAVVVLQLRQSATWGGTSDEYFTGHVANGRRVMGDARDVTRHIIAGLAQSLSGVVPPYSRPRSPFQSSPTTPNDWRWAVGATPFGPYSNFSGVSEITQNVARRNLLLVHAAAALRAAQHKLDELDEFVGEHFQPPWASAGIDGEKTDGRRHFLDTVVNTRHGFKTAITADTVASLEAEMAGLTKGVEDLAVELFSHGFEPADFLIKEALLPYAASLMSGIDAALEDARGIMECCRARHVSSLGRVIRTAIAAAAGFTVIFVVGITVASVNARRRRSSNGMRLPSYTYSRPASRQTSSWQL